MAMAITGEPHEATMDAITGEPHESPITDGVDGARGRRRLASGCNAGWCVSARASRASPPSCVTLPLPSYSQRNLRDIVRMRQRIWLRLRLRLFGRALRLRQHLL